MDSMRYSQMIRRLFEQVDFEKLGTTEPNIQMDPANIFLARIGSKVSPERVAQFHERRRSAYQAGRAPF